MRGKFGYPEDMIKIYGRGVTNLNPEDYTQNPPKKNGNLALIIGVILFALIVSFSLLGCAWGAEITPPNLWKGLIAEDVSGGYQGMYAVACCVRNRLNVGMNTGLVALKRKDLNSFVERQGSRYELMAKDIIRKVFNENSPDVTKGATHYEAVERYGLPKWAKGMVRTTKIGDHTYFRRVR
jgi:hypothetical protein